MYATLSFLEARYDETIVIIAGHCGIRFGDSPTNTNPLPSDSWHSKQIADQNFIPRLPQTHLLFGIIPTLKSNVSALFVSVFSNGHRPLNSRWKPLTTVERKESGMLAFPPPPCAPPPNNWANWQMKFSLCLSWGLVKSCLLQSNMFPIFCSFNSKLICKWYGRLVLLRRPNRARELPANWNFAVDKKKADQEKPWKQDPLWAGNKSVSQRHLQIRASSCGIRVQAEVQMGTYRWGVGDETRQSNIMPNAKDY